MPQNRNWNSQEQSPGIAHFKKNKKHKTKTLKNLLDHYKEQLLKQLNLMIGNVMQNKHCWALE